ncbi:EAL domain-containing protein [Saccharothrix syringae]|nr:EAL domain-containing protein [Saccharothrix syringae]
MLRWILSWIPGTSAFAGRRRLDADLDLLARLGPPVLSEEDKDAALARIRAAVDTASPSSRSPLGEEVTVSRQADGHTRPAGFEEMVAEWAKALAATVYLPLDQRQLRERLTLMANGLLEHASGGDTLELPAERIGRELAQDLRLTAEAFQNGLELIIPWLERTQRHTGQGSAASRAGALAALAAGYAAGARDRILDEQLDITGAGLTAVHAELRDRVRGNEHTLSRNHDRGQRGPIMTDTAPPMGVLDIHGTVLQANPALLRLLRCPDHEVVGTPLVGHITDEHSREAVRSCIASAVRHPGTPHDTRFALGGHDRDTTWVGAALAWHPDRPYDDPAGGRMLMALADITGHHNRQQRVHPEDDYDPVTQLSTRRRFLHTLHTILRPGVAHEPEVVGVCALRLDDLATVTAAMGPAAADRVLVSAASRITAALADHSPATVARIDRDRFAILLTTPCDWSTITDLVRRLVDWTRGPYTTARYNVSLSVSVGLVQALPGVRAEHLLRQAEAELDAQYRGQRRIHTDTEPVDHGEIRHDHLLTAVPHALRRGEITLAYHPIVDLTSSVVVGVEATAVWAHPDHGDIPADDLLCEAEAIGLARDWGPWMLNQATRQAARWSRALGKRAPQMALNIPPGFAVDDGFVDHLTRALRDNDLPPRRLLLLMTESSIVDRRGRLRRHLVHLGGTSVPLALAGLGSDTAHYDSLPHLTIDTLVIAPTVTAGIAGVTAADHGHHATLAEALIKMGRRLTHTVMLKGITTREQVKAARRMKADLGLGELFGGPQPPDAIEAMIVEGAVAV